MLQCGHYTILPEKIVGPTPSTQLAGRFRVFRQREVRQLLNQSLELDVDACHPLVRNAQLCLHGLVQRWVLNELLLRITMAYCVPKGHFKLEHLLASDAHTQLLHAFLEFVEAQHSVGRAIEAREEIIGVECLDVDAQFVEFFFHLLVRDSVPELLLGHAVVRAALVRGGILERLELRSQCLLSVLLLLNLLLLLCLCRHRVDVIG
mmetsp:Transcript_35509/g.114967  ORF Transcript_35509/g.114967 Transcript_35509/m.114967 type:complete len:206 (+) Transcript_35509:131-748(+)